MTEISADFPYQKKFASVNGRRMAYVDEGEGDAIIFQHGNPTSSYLWRNVMPHLAGQGRLIAPDLIGMGDSEKLPDSGPDRYTFAEHAGYLDALLEQLDIGDKVIWVIHDWGSALGFHWANRHRDRVQGIAFMEAIVMPLRWDDWPDNAKSIFQAFRSPAGEEVVLSKNVFVEGVLPSAVMRGLGEAEMAVYRKPFASPGEDRRPTLTWPRQIPVEGEPADVVALVEDYGRYMRAADSPPKLFVNADPGSILTGRARDEARSWSHLEEVTVAGTHFIQEDSPHEIGAAVSAFVRKLRN